MLKHLLIELFGLATTQSWLDPNGDLALVDIGRLRKNDAFSGWWSQRMRFVVVGVGVLWLRVGMVFSAT